MDAGPEKRCLLRALARMLSHFLIFLILPACAHYTRQSEEEDSMASGSGLVDENGTNSTTTAPHEPVLTPSAIANIICSVLAILLLTSLLCYLTHTFNNVERKTRIRTALEANRRIDQQIAAAKARAEQRLKEANYQVEQQQKGREACAQQGSREALNIFEVRTHRHTVERASTSGSMDSRPLGDDVPLLIASKGSSSVSEAPVLGCNSTEPTHKEVRVVKMTEEMLQMPLSTDDRT